MVYETHHNKAKKLWRYVEDNATTLQDAVDAFNHCAPEIKQNTHEENTIHADDCLT